MHYIVDLGHLGGSSLSDEANEKLYDCLWETNKKQEKSFLQHKTLILYLLSDSLELIGKVESDLIEISYNVLF